MGRHGSAGTAAVFLLYHLAKFLYSHLTTTHLEQSAHYGTHHIAEEAVGLDYKAPLVLVHLLPSGLHDAAVVGGHIGMELAEAGEVHIIEEAASSLVHPLKVGGMEEAHGTMTAEGVLGRRHIVVVGARGGAEAGMRIRTYGLHTLHGNVGWKYAVELVSKALAIYLLLGIEVGNHLQGMHTSIGATGTRDRGILAQERGEGLGQGLLHGDAVGLYLPTVIVGAVVGKGDEMSHLILNYEL